MFILFVLHRMALRSSDRASTGFTSTSGKVSGCPVCGVTQLTLSSYSSTKLLVIGSTGDTVDEVSWHVREGCNILRNC